MVYVPIHDATGARARLVLARVRKGFTLIELLVVLFIIVIVLAIAAPSVKTLLRGNSQSQASNAIRAYLATARSVAISQHRQAGVVFFEETATFATTSGLYTGQTAMQIMVESTNQTGASATNTIFVYYSKSREYLPKGIQVSSLNDDPSTTVLTGQNSSGTNTRVVLFDANGQMILRNGIARPDDTGSSDGGYPHSYRDWQFVTKAGSASGSVSSPGVLVFDLNDFNAYVNSSSANDPMKSLWIQQHADVLIVNAYTGNLIR